MEFRGLSGFACGNCLARLPPEALYNEGTFSEYSVLIRRPQANVQTATTGEAS